MIDSDRRESVARSEERDKLVPQGRYEASSPRPHEPFQHARRRAWKLASLGSFPRSALLIGLCRVLSARSLRRAAAGYKTTNFVVSAPTPQLAKEIGDTAEVCRRQLAIEWLGEEMPPWSKPCPINAQVAPNLGAGGATSFVFDRGEVFGWQMNIQGSRERMLDSVLPHEVTHTIFASHFRQPLPRWADEGACTTVEHRSEIAKQERMLIEFLKTGRGIPFSADVRDEGVSAGRDAALRAGSLAGAVG